MNAIVVLTRGYPVMKSDKKLDAKARWPEDYSWLIKRNKHLEDKKIENCDYLFFHEGNIPEEHQNYIKGETPSLNLIFIDISECWLTEAPAAFTGESRPDVFKLSYRNMCNFWFCEFWKYVEKYDKIFRLDEDCYIRSHPQFIFNMLDAYDVIAGKWEVDMDFVTKGMNKLTLDFLKKNNILDAKGRSPSGPYTNGFGLNLRKLRQNKLLFDYVKEVKDSLNIYIRRWGDLPLWGEACVYLNISHHVIELKYYHESHHKNVN